MTSEAADALLPVYARAPLAFERGEGCWLYTAEGEAYLDCLAGIAVTGLGHGHAAVVAALKAQADRLWHTSNIFRVPGQEALARRLTDATFADRVFFTNSGTEAIECALKMARKFHSAAGAPERIEVLGFDGAFHGRTYAALFAAGNPKYTAGFGPPPPGYRQLPFGDLAAVEAALGPTTAAIILEPVQGEGGARAWPDADLTTLRAIADRAGVLLIHDEIQCGLGRTGRLFASDWARDAAPDILCIAKALGNGFPVGACLAGERAASGMGVGAHGSTYGGNPLAMAVAGAAFAELSRPELHAHVRQIAGLFAQSLHGLKDRFPDVIAEVRGRGLLIGLKLIPNNRAFMALARDERLLIGGGGENCVRLLPPLVISSEEAREAAARLERACEAARRLPEAA